MSMLIPDRIAPRQFFFWVHSWYVTIICVVFPPPPTLIHTHLPRLVVSFPTSKTNDENQPVPPPHWSHLIF
jgi:hypothetical protein